MKDLIWGTRTLARSFGVNRDAIRGLIDRNKLTPSRLKRDGSFYLVFDKKDQKVVREHINKKKKTG